jgi:hypothetical protein
VVVTDLSHLRWTLTNDNRHPYSEASGVYLNTSVSVPAKLPGTIWGALFLSGVIDDPLVGFNEQLYRWVALSDWTYTTTLDLVAEDVGGGGGDGTVVELHLQNVDCYATVEWDGKVVATLSNSFVRFVIPLSPHLKSGPSSSPYPSASPSSSSLSSSSYTGGAHTLRLRFQSALTRAAAAAAAYPYPVPHNSDLIACKTWPCPQGRNLAACISGATSRVHRDMWH